MDFLGDANASAAVDVVTFVREVIERNADMRTEILQSMFARFGEMTNAKVIRGALWIVGEYCQDHPMIVEAFKVIKQAVGEVPILASETRMAEEALKAAEPTATGE